MANITLLTESSTFKSWYETTNLLVNNHNANTVTNGQAPLGIYKIGYDANTSNTYLFVANTFYVDSAKITVNVAATTFNANVTIGQKAETFTLAAQTVTISTNTRFDGNTTVNATLTILGGVSATANVSVNAFTVTGNTEATNLNANGVASVRQLVFGQSAAVCANSPVTGSPFNDWNPTGLANAAVLNITPDGGGILITGIAAPTYIGAAGAQVLYIQNLSATYSVNLYSSNTSSTAANRIKTPGDSTLELPPGGSISLIYTKANQQWRPLSAAVSTGTVALANNATYAYGKTEGNLNVNNATTATTAGTAGSASIAYGKNEGNLNVNNATTAYGKSEGSLSVSYATSAGTAYGKNEGNLSVNNAAYAYGKSEGNLNVNNATTAYGKTEGNLNVNNAAYAYGKGEGNLNANSALTANNATNAFGKTEGNLNVNAAVYATNSTNLAGATSTFNGALKYTGASARLVIPVGTNLYAT